MSRKPFDIKKARKGDPVVAFVGNKRFPGVFIAAIAADEDRDAAVLIDHYNPDESIMRLHLGDKFYKGTKGTPYEVWGVQHVYAARLVDGIYVERVRNRK